MSSVQIKSEIFFLNWHLKRQDIKTIEIAEQLFAKGGYSSLYEIRTDLLHDLNSNVGWLLKLSYTSDSICKTGYRNIVELSNKIEKWQSEKYSEYVSMFAEYQSLIGFPQAHFVGEFEGQEVYGYIMPNLNDLGYTHFSEIEDNEGIHNEYLERSLDEKEINNRLKVVYNLAKTFHLLEETFEYSHGDIKSKSVWVNLDTYKTVIIDFDGGTFRPKRWDLKKIFGAQIMGELQPWLAPEILKEVNEATGKAKLEVSWESDYWSFTCGAFHILTGITPFAFLKETSFYAWKNYLKTYDWPGLEVGSEDQNIQKEEADALNGLFDVVRSRKGVWSLFKSTFNEGFKNKSRRATYGNWTTLLFSEISEKEPKIDLTLSPKTVLEGSVVDISWECATGIIFINGKSCPAKGDLHLAMDHIPLIKVLNEFGEWPVSLDVEIVRKPVVTGFQVSEASIPVDKPIEFKWQSSYVDKVNAIVDGHNYQVTGNTFECSPKSSQEVEVKFASKYGLDILSKTVAIEVVHPVVIENFVSDKDFIAETLPVLLKWKTTNADEIKIENTDKAFETSGEISIRPKQSGEIVLKARNKFFNCEKSIYIEVFPIPKIENIKLPPFPNFNIPMPDFSSSIPMLLDKIDLPKELFNQIFTENESKKDS